MRRANKVLNEALQRLEKATAEAREYTARANIAAREAFEARERADIAQRELETLLGARKERHAMVAGTIATAYEVSFSSRWASKQAVLMLFFRNIPLPTKWDTPLLLCVITQLPLLYL